MLKRNRAFVVKILFFFFVYYSLTIFISNSAQSDPSEEVKNDDVDSRGTELIPEQKAFIENNEKNDAKDVVLEAPAVAGRNKEEEEKGEEVKKDESIKKILIKKDDEKEKKMEPVAKNEKEGVNDVDERKVVKKEEKKVAVGQNFAKKGELKDEKDTEDKKIDKMEEKKEAEEQNFALLPPGKGSGPGENGKPYKVDKEKVDKEIKKRIERGWQNNAYNEYVSDLISVHRSLPDLRDEYCKAADSHLPDLPQTSVIVCFHNEAWSVLLRTVHSILNRSPEKLLAEILLVDDASDMDHLKEDLENYMAQYPQVKIIRAKERIGLIRARLMGAAKATAPVLTFLDSHIECTPGWLEPLLDTIARDSTNVVCPVIDVIDTETLEYQGGTYFAVGGFDWNLVFNWHSVPEHENKRRGHSWAPAHSPTMAGGLFSIDKLFFEKLGAYDPGFDIWGAENLELSFKTWMCGGTLFIIPCSHVGHIFRKRSPYKWRSNVNVVLRNNLRLAEVWLDDYKEYYYQRIGTSKTEYGDISSRLQLREELQCKSFKWYLDTVFPELFIPGDAAAQGYIKNIDSNYCLDSPGRPADLHKPLGPYPCHNQGGHQYWLWSGTGEIRRDDSCLDYGGTEVILYPCHGSRGNQWWKYDDESKLLRHVVSRKCLAVAEARDKFTMEDCSTDNTKLRWSVQNYNQTVISQEL